MNQSKPMLKAPEFLLFGFFDLKPFSHQSMISTLSFCAEPMRSRRFHEEEPRIDMDSATSGKPSVLNDMRMKGDN